MKLQVGLLPGTFDETLTADQTNFAFPINIINKSRRRHLHPGDRQRRFSKLVHTCNIERPRLSVDLVKQNPDLVILRRRRAGFSTVVVCGHCLVTLSLTINEILKRLSSLPTMTVMQNHSGGDSVVLGIVSVFPHLVGSRSPPIPLRRHLGIKQT